MAQAGCLPWHTALHCPAGSHGWGPQSGNLTSQIAGLPSPLYPQHPAISLRGAHWGLWKERQKGGRLEERKVNESANE